MRKFLLAGSALCLLIGFAASRLVAADNAPVGAVKNVVDEFALADEEKGPARDGEKPKGPRDGEKPRGPRDGETPKGPRDGDTAPPRREEGEKSTVRGTVESFTKNPDDVVDGMVLDNGKTIRFPADMGERVSKAVSPKDEVELEVTLLPGRDGEKRMRIETIKNVKSGEIVKFVPRPRREGEAERRGPQDGDKPSTGPRDGDEARKGPRDGEQPRTGPRDGDNAPRGPQDGAGQQRRGPNPEEALAEIRAIRKLLNLPASAPEAPPEGQPREGDRPAPPQNRVLKELRDLRAALEKRSPGEQDK